MEWKSFVFYDLCSLGKENVSGLKQRLNCDNLISLILGALHCLKDGVEHRSFIFLLRKFFSSFL